MFFRIKRYLDALKSIPKVNKIFAEFKLIVIISLMNDLNN